MDATTMVDEPTVVMTRRFSPFNLSLFELRVCSDLPQDSV